MALKYKSSSVPVKESMELRVPIPFLGATLKYSFGSDHYDINFSLLFESDRGDSFVLVPDSRVASHVEPVVGTHTFTAAGGFAVLVFDNSFSWWRSKSVSYVVSLEPPDKNKLKDLKYQMALKKMTSCSEDIDRAQRRQARLSSEASELRQDLAKLEDQVASIQSAIKTKSRLVADLEKEDTWLKQRIMTQKRRTIPNLVISLATEWLRESEPSEDQDEGSP